MNIGSVNFEGDFLEKLKQFSGRGSKMDCLLKKGVAVKLSFPASWVIWRTIADIFPPWDILRKVQNLKT